MALELGVPDAPAGRGAEGAGRGADVLVESERVLASVCEAIIGAAYLAFGIERTAPAVVRAVRRRIDEALEHPEDYKSLLQERLARRAERVGYRTSTSRARRTSAASSVVAEVDGRRSAAGRERPRRRAEQEAALQALAPGGGCG